MDPEPSDSREVDESQRKAEDPQTARLRERYLGRAAPSPLSLAGAGLELAGIVLVLTAGGWWLDGALGTGGPWIMISGVAIGTIGGMYNLWRRGKRFFR